MNNGDLSKGKEKRWRKACIILSISILIIAVVNLGISIAAMKFTKEEIEDTESDIEEIQEEGGGYIDEIILLYYNDYQDFMQDLFVRSILILVGALVLFPISIMMWRGKRFAAPIILSGFLFIFFSFMGGSCFITASDNFIVEVEDWSTQFHFLGIFSIICASILLVSIMVMGQMLSIKGKVKRAKEIEIEASDLTNFLDDPQKTKDGRLRSGDERMKMMLELKEQMTKFPPQTKNEQSNVIGALLGHIEFLRLPSYGNAYFLVGHLFGKMVTSDEWGDDELEAMGHRILKAQRLQKGMMGEEMTTPAFMEIGAAYHELALRSEKYREVNLRRSINAYKTANNYLEQCHTPSLAGEIDQKISELWKEV